jgi:flavin reductase (DIM6/NTAB) family NADH-FMN oxidoreductase RutF
MLLGIAPNHFTASLIDHSGEVGLHLLRREQTELALHFAHGSGRNRDKLAGLPLLNASAAPPLLANCLAWFHVRVFARYHAGDRIFYWADVVAAAQLGNSPPLREQELLQSLTAEQRQILLDGRQSDLEQHRPWHHAWRIANPFVPGSVSHTVGGVQ